VWCENSLLNFSVSAVLVGWPRIQRTQPAVCAKKMLACLWSSDGEMQANGCFHRFHLYFYHSARMPYFHLIFIIFNVEDFFFVLFFSIQFSLLRFRNLGLWKKLYAILTSIHEHLFCSAREGGREGGREWSHARNLGLWKIKIRPAVRVLIHRRKNKWGDRKYIIVRRY
jgi:hypothetical protein